MHMNQQSQVLNILEIYLFFHIYDHLSVTRLVCSPLASNFWSTPVLVHKGLIHGVMTSLPWQTGLQSWQSCTIALAHSVGYKWRSYWDSPSEGLISYMWIQSDSDLTSLINFQGVCVTRLVCSPLASNFWSTPVLVHKGLIYGVMTSLPWQTSLQSWQSCTIALAHSVGYISSPYLIDIFANVYRVFSHSHKYFTFSKYIFSFTYVTSLFGRHSCIIICANNFSNCTHMYLSQC